MPGQDRRLNCRYDPPRFLRPVNDHFATTDSGSRSPGIGKMTAHGPAGHAGVPRPDNAILRLGRALAAISDYAADPAHGVSPPGYV